MLVPEDGAKKTLPMVKLVSDLLCLVVELKEEVGRLRSIWGREREIGWWSNTLSAVREAQQMSEEPCPFCHQAGGGDLVDRGEWKEVPSWGR